MLYHVIKAFFLCALILFCSQANANDTGLYDPKAPDDAVFLRFINATALDQQPSVGNKKYPKVKASEVSPYYVLKGGAHKVSNILIDKEIVVDPNNFYSVIVSDDFTLIKDQVSDNPTKAIVALYNLGTINPLTIKAKEGSVDVLSDVSLNEMKARDINAVKIDLSLYSEGKKLLDLPETILERRNHYSVIYNNAGAKIITASTDTTK